MKKSVLIAVRFFLLAMLFSAVSRAQLVEDDLSYITPETLPPMKLVVEKALGSLPKSLGELQDFDRRMRLSALAPNLMLRYRTFEGPSRRFDTRDLSTDRTIRNSNRNFNEVDKVAADPLDSFLQETEGSGSNFQRFSETRFGVPVAMNDEEVWREEYAVQAVWRLSDFFYHPDEIKAATANRVVAGYRVQFMEKIVSLYRVFGKSVAQKERSPDNQQAFENVEDRLVILDTLTDNFISDYAKSRHAKLTADSAALAQPVPKRDTGRAVPSQSPEFSPSVEADPATEVFPYQANNAATAAATASIFSEQEDEEMMDGMMQIDASMPGDNLDPRVRSLTGEGGEREDDDFYEDDYLGTAESGLDDDSLIEIPVPVVETEDSDF